MDKYLETGVTASHRWRLRREGIGQLLMTLAFFASFVPYVVDTSGVALIGALSVFLVIGGLVIPLLNQDRAGALFHRLGKMRFAMFGLLLPIGPSVVAASGDNWNAVGYASLMTMTLAVCQIVLGAITLRRLLRAFSIAGFFAVMLFAVLNWHRIMHSMLSGTRLISPYAQPNAIGFIFTGFAIALASRLVDRAMPLSLRLGCFLSSLTCVGIIFLAQSRASLLAIGCAVAFVAGALGIRVIRRNRLAIRWLLVFAILLVIGAPSVLVVRPSYAKRATSYAVRMLRIESQYRGIGSGLSGRLPRWNKTLMTIESNGLWVFGAGYRTSKRELGFSVDNGYLTILYEAGLIGLLAILLQLLWLLRASARGHILRETEGRDVLMLTVLGLLAAFLVNNGFDRYLFGLGNPFSLLGLFFILTDRGVLREKSAMVASCRQQTSGQCNSTLREVARLDGGIGA